MRFHAEMDNVAGNLGVDAIDPAFDEAAEEAWISKVRPALLELDDLVEEKHLRTQFGPKLPRGGVVGTAGGLVTGIITPAPLIGDGVAAGAAVIAAAAALGGERAQLERLAALAAAAGWAAERGATFRLSEPAPALQEKLARVGLAPAIERGVHQPLHAKS